MSCQHVSNSTKVTAMFIPDFGNVMPKGLVKYYRTQCGNTLYYYQTDDMFQYCPYCGEKIETIERKKEE